MEADPDCKALRDDELRDMTSERATAWKRLLRSELESAATLEEIKTVVLHLINTARYKS